jgi:CubicO group peptidase (beta-lactamase class C family)
MKPSENWRFGSARSFGSPGSGGSLGFADPAAGVGYAYVTSQMGTALTGDPRDVALREALYSALQVAVAQQPAAPATTGAETGGVKRTAYPVHL